MVLFRLTPLLLIALVTAGCDNHSTLPRYQVVSNPQMTDTYLLDNQKGRIWQLTTATDVPGHPVEVWEEIDIIDSKGEIGMTHDEFIKLHAADAKLQPPQDLISAQPAGKFVPDALAPGANAGKGKFDFSTAKP
jgi:hypothetical protein